MEYFQKQSYSPATVLAFLKLLQEKIGQTFGIWNSNTELIKTYLEPIYNNVRTEGIIKEWTEDQIKEEFGSRSYGLILWRFKKNLVLSISKEQVMSLKEILAIIKTKIFINKTDEKPNNIDTKLLDALPKKAKYKEVRKIATQMIRNKKVENWILARCITPSLLDRRNNKRKLSRSDYSNSKEDYNKKIKNRLDTINGKWENLGHKIKFHADFSELTSLNQTANL